MTIQKLRKGDTIGFVCPSHIADRERIERNVTAMESLGFHVKLGANIYKDTYGYLASEQERADDFNDMVSDNNVKMILFGGGEGGNEILPYLDFESIKKYPKYICSYSDGTTILNAIHSITGLTVYYGQAPGMFNDLRHYDYTQFASHFLDNNTDLFAKNSKWQTMYTGICEGELIGGYARNFALMLGNKYFIYDESKKYVLFLEDHEKFSNIAKVSSFISHIEQNDFIHNVSGLIFGHYSETIFPDLLMRLERFGKKHSVPVVYCDDFGHGVNHAILPIGKSVTLDTYNQSLAFTSLTK